MRRYSRGARLLSMMLIPLGYATLAHGQLSVALQTPKPRLFMCEPIEILISVANDGNKPAVLLLPKSPGGRDSPVEYVVCHRKALDGSETSVAPLRIRSARKRRPIAGTLSDRVVILGPGESLKVTSFLNEWFDLAKEGTYRVSCVLRPSGDAIAQQHSQVTGLQFESSQKEVSSSNSVTFELVRPTAKWTSEYETSLIARHRDPSLSRNDRIATVVSLISIGTEKAWDSIVSTASKTGRRNLIPVLERGLLTHDDSNAACSLAAQLLSKRSPALRRLGTEVIRLRGYREHAKLLKGTLDDDNRQVRWSALSAVDTLLHTGIGRGLKRPPEIGGPELQRAKELLGQ